MKLYILSFLTLIASISAWTQAELDVQVINLTTLGAEAGMPVSVIQTGTGASASRNTGANGIAHFSLTGTGRYAVVVAPFNNLSLVDTVFVQVRSNQSAFATVLVYNPQSFSL
ncbi:MAG: hypothetical protein RL226_2269, partial [Bacteroidota bacterium]